METQLQSAHNALPDSSMGIIKLLHFIPCHSRMLPAYNGTDCFSLTVASVAAACAVVHCVPEDCTAGIGYIRAVSARISANMMSRVRVHMMCSVLALLNHLPMYFRRHVMMSWVAKPVYRSAV